MSQPAQILVVCTGNVCRSPLAERLLRLWLDQELGAGSPVLVASAGTRAMVGDPMTDDAAAELAGLGGDATGSSGRLLEPSLVAGADLVVTATRAHRGDVVKLHPRALRYTFTLRELARLLDDADLHQLPDDPADRVRAVPALAAARRGFAQPVDGADDDIEDPMGRSRAAYARTTEQIVPAVETLVAAIADRSDPRA